MSSSRSDRETHPRTFSSGCPRVRESHSVPEARNQARDLACASSRDLFVGAGLEIATSSILGREADARRRNFRRSPIVFARPVGSKVALDSRVVSRNSSPAFYASKLDVRYVPPSDSRFAAWARSTMKANPFAGSRAARVSLSRRWPIESAEPRQNRGIRAEERLVRVKMGRWSNT